MLVLFGDTPLLRAETLRAVLDALDEKTAVAVLGFKPTGANEYGRLVAKAGDVLERIVEWRDASAKERKIPLCNSGVMAVRGEHLFGLLDGLKPNNAKGEFYLTDIVALARKAKLRARVVEGAAEDLLGVNSRADLAVAEAVLQQRLRAAAMADGVTMTDPSTVYLSADTRLARDVSLGPNVFFGPGVSIGEGTRHPRLLPYRRGCASARTASSVPSRGCAPARSWPTRCMSAISARSRRRSSRAARK